MRERAKEALKAACDGKVPFMSEEKVKAALEEPEWLYVVSSSSKYFKYDGMSFGVGDESGYVYHAQCRAATPEEYASAERERDQATMVSKARVLLKDLEHDILDRGERPCGTDNVLEGEVMFDTTNVYGSGSWWVVGTEWIWYVRNNGMDGDDWSRNNVRTGGAGAIGVRVSYDKGLHDKLLSVKASFDGVGTKSFHK
jgi:hypothetical protein